MNPCDTCKNFSELIDSAEYQNEQLVDALEVCERVLNPDNHSTTGMIFNAHGKVKALLANREPVECNHDFSVDFLTCSDGSKLVSCAKCGMLDSK